MSYFDSTKSGRIINRFSSDLGAIDGQVMSAVFYFFLVCCFMVMELGTCIVGSPTALLPCLITAPYLWGVQIKFRASAREVQRLASTTRSPVFSAFTETLGGVSSVRAFKAEERLAKANDSRILTNLSASYNSNALSSWLGLRLSSTGTFIYAVCVFFAVFQHQVGWNTSAIGRGSALAAGVVGLSLNQVTEFTSSLGGIIQLFTAAEVSLVKLERLLAFIKLEPERPLVEPTDTRLPTQWPTAGKIEFKRVKVSI